MNELPPSAQNSLHTRTGGDAGPRAPYHPGTAPLTLRLLGGFAVSRGARTVSHAHGGRSGARLVRYLLVHRDTAVTEAAILDALWPGVGAGQARCNLQLAMSEARQVLDEPCGNGSALSVARGRYRLCLGWHDRVDADYFEAVAAMALRDHGPGRRVQLNHALACWTGEPLPEERGSAWAAAWRDRLQALRSELLQAQAELPNYRSADARSHGRGPVHIARPVAGAL